MRRYNCVTGGLASGRSLPPDCWQYRFPTFGKVALATVPSNKVDSRVESMRHSRNVALSERVATLGEAGKLDVDAVTELVREFGLVRVRALRAHLPKKCSLNAAIDEAIRLGRWRKPVTKKLKPRKIHPPKPAKPPRPTLSPEFEKAIADWKVFSDERAARLKEANRPYDPLTVPRRIEDARRFLEFLQAEGVTQWPMLAQRHLDAYTVATDRSSAQRAYTFLRFAQRRFRFTTKLKRPADAKRNMLDDIATEDQVRVALENAGKHRDTEEALIVFFVALYGQTLATCVELTTDRIHRTDAGVAVEFHELPLPLDEETGKLVLARFKALSAPRQGVRLFQRSRVDLEDRTNVLAKCPLKKLRLAAVANIMREGYTDRRGLVRGIGISTRTLKLIEPVIGWDLQDSISDEVAELRSDLLHGRLR